MAWCPRGVTDSGNLADAAAVGVAETHISVVFFTRDRAFKLLKPVTTAFLDHSDRDDRLEAIDRELRLNSRLAPDVYLGSADVVEEGEVVDRMLVMRRMPAARRLATLLATDARDQVLRSVARAVATFHAALPAMADRTLLDSADGLRSLWESSFLDIEPVVGTVIEPTEFHRVRTLVRRYLFHQRELFERRRAAGLVRDGHGDLTAEDVFMLDDGPRILDCLAFDDDLRICDVLGDIGFLVMDVHRLAGVEAAQRLLRDYAEFSGEHHPGSLAHHYVAYRAHVRAKIEVIRHQQGRPEALEPARRYHALALHHLERAKLRLVLVGGGPGSGKTTLSHAIANETDWVVVDSDELRKDLASVGHLERLGERPGEGLYSPGHTAATYEAMCERAGALLAAGESVVLDASWTDASHREAARHEGARRGAEIVELECHVDAAEARRRVRARAEEGRSPSDAGPEIIEFLADRRDPWPSAVTIDTSVPVEAAMRAALDAVGRNPEENGPMASSPSTD